MSPTDSTAPHRTLWQGPQQGRPPLKKTSDTCGLSLVEVMIAVLIMGIGISSLVAAATKSLAVAQKAREYETVRRLIGQVDLEVPIDLEEIDEGVETGRFSGRFSDYSWKREIEELEADELQMYLVTTSVSWSDRGQQVTETVRTYVHGPSYERRNIAGNR